VRRAGLLVFFSVLIVYVSFPTKNYYWDGIMFAQDIETGSVAPGFLHPNHLLYNPLGRELWLAANAIGLNLRALTVLQIVSMVTGAATIALMFCVLVETGASTYVALCLAMAFGFSATWWRYATDAASYVPSTFLIVMCLLLLVRKEPPGPIATGLLLCSAMLLHQLAALFVPAAALALWQRSKERPRSWRLINLLQFVLAAGVPTVGLYAMVFAIQHEAWTLREFMRWVVSHSQDVSFSFDLPRNIWTSIRGHIRLVFGGNLRLVLAQRSPVSLVAAVALSVTLLLLIRRLVQIPPAFLRPLRSDVRRLLPVLLLWWGTYAVFLVVWLPRNTFYRLFYLPVLVILGSALIPDVKTPYNRLALAVAALFLLNFGFYIYPQTKPESNPTLQVADEMRAIWKPGDVVYWDVFRMENRTIRYFNPQVEWRELWGRAYTSQIETSFKEGGDVWFDSTALSDYRRQDQGLESWLLANCHINESYEFPVGNNVVGFTRLQKLKGSN
jgi:hypothetical protein